MPAYQRKFQLRILTPEGSLYHAEAMSAVVPAADGELGILGGHAPVLAMLGAGSLRVEEVNGTVRKFFVAGGFLHVRGDETLILAEECQPKEQVTKEKAQERLEQAQQLPHDTPEATDRRNKETRIAQARLHFAEAPM